jgi:acetyltransferase-like isoleucine patch superfamily enzyme
LDYKLVATFASNSNFGQNAGSGATNARNSNFLGLNSDYQASTANNSNFFGVSAGYKATSANNSTLIGFNVGNANVLSSIGPNNIIIGTNISLSAGTTNSINLGGVLFAGTHIQQLEIKYSPTNKW